MNRVETPTASKNKRRQLKLFLADDSALLRAYVTDILREVDGVQIIGHAATAPKAVESIAKLKPDVVILDIQMPGGSGIDVLETIKALEPAPFVIMFTNYPYPQYQKRCLEAGADFFLDKSLEFEALIHVLKTLTRLSEDNLLRPSE